MLAGRWLANSSRIHLRHYTEDFARSTADHDLVLDAGAGDAPYRELFAHAHYETADFDRSYSSTYMCDLTSIPVADDRFHRILLTQTLEHVPDPLAVLRELHRVLRPDGMIICSCPLFYEEHMQPYDYYRYTQFAHHYLFERAGFRIERLEWLEGYLGTLAYQLDCACRYLPASPRRLGGGVVGWAAAPVIGGIKIAAFVLAGLLYRLDVRARITDAGLPKNYVIIARKPA